MNLLYNQSGDNMRKVDKIILTIIALIVIIPIIINEVNEYNLRKLKEETLKISEFLKNESPTLTEINIKSNKEIKDGLKTRGHGKAFVEGEKVIVILSYKKYCSVKTPLINEVALSKSKCKKLSIKDGILIEE